MAHRSVLALAALLAMLSIAPLSMADPAAPQSDSPCSAELTDVTTLPSGTSSPLRCQAGRWEPVAQPAEPSDRWLSTGPTTTLHGQGLRNPNMLAGSWTAAPLDPSTRCRAEQRAVLGPGIVSEPQVAQGNPDQPLTFEVSPTAYTIDLSGNCVWTRGH